MNIFSIRNWNIPWIALGLLLATVSAAGATNWTETVFENKTDVARGFIALPSHDPERAQTVIGTMRRYRVDRKDTLLDIGRYFDLGYNEITQANPRVDPWVPKPGSFVTLPTEWILPDVEMNGLVLNIPDMRLYYLRPQVDGTVIVYTFPVGLGRDHWRTPQATFRVRGKTINPTWVLPESIKAERRRDGMPVPDFIAGGAADNPLGKYRLELTLPSYGVHGTDLPWGVGREVSHGCVRLYPEDIERLFPMVPVGTPGAFVYQPVKVGMRDGRVFIEVDKDLYDLMPAPYREAVRLIDKFGWDTRVDFRRVQQAALEQSGLPTDVTLDHREDHLGTRLSAAPAGVGQTPVDQWHASPSRREPCSGDEKRVCSLSPSRESTSTTWRSLPGIH
jgi:L,D-transpeptidase ErfK/SrfK